MRAIKKINNNTALCVDGNGRELIAVGKGIGFEKTPCEIELSRIQRTYYDVDKRFVGLLAELPERIFEISDQIVEQAKMELKKELSPNLVFSMADHIHFAIERQRKGIHVKMPLSYDVEHLYPEEMELAKKAVKLIRRELKTPLPKSEEIGIALHFINNIFESAGSVDSEVETVLEGITDILEEELGIEVNRKGFEYHRFCTHMRYFVKRLREGKQIRHEKSELYQYLNSSSPDIHGCSRKITGYLGEIYETECTEEETAYLMIYLIRLYNNKD